MKQQHTKFSTAELAKAGVIAALYTALTVLVYPLAFGGMQVRLSEMLTVLPAYMPSAVPGLTVGCFLSNLIGLSMGANPAGAWDLLFGTDIFPKEIFATETASYYKHINAYGMPLDNRETYTKSDWLVWSATLCDDPAYFKAMVEPLWEAYNVSESRVPLTDWYDTVTALQICWDDSVSSGKIGFQNRTVQGGIFIKLLMPQR